MCWLWIGRKAEERQVLPLLESRGLCAEAALQGISSAFLAAFSSYSLNPQLANLAPVTIHGWKGRWFLVHEYCVIIHLTLRLAEQTWDSVYVHRNKSGDMKGKVNTTSWEHVHACQSLSRAGVAMNGQQIVLPLHLLHGGLSGDRPWQEPRVKKNSCVSPVVHFLSGMGEPGCEVSLPWPCPLLCPEPAGGGEGAWTAPPLSILGLDKGVSPH